MLSKSLKLFVFLNPAAPAEVCLLLHATVRPPYARAGVRFGRFWTRSVVFSCVVGGLTAKQVSSTANCKSHVTRTESL